MTNANLKTGCQNLLVVFKRFNWLSISKYSIMRFHMSIENVGGIVISSRIAFVDNSSRSIDAHYTESPISPQAVV